MAKRQQMVQTLLPGPVVAELEKTEDVEQADRSTVMRKLLYRAIRDWKLEHYAQEYGQGRMTMARAAEEAGVSVREMMDYVRQRRTPAQYSLEDLEHDVKVVGRRVGKRRGD